MAKAVLQVRAQLRGVDPVVWRRLLVPGTAGLDKLDRMVQAAMGWTNSHLHCFRVGPRTYGPVLEELVDDDLVDADERELSVEEAFNEQRRLVYEYDFGDSWEHDIVLEDRLSAGVGLKFAVCTAGENACPPEDCGGPHGYRQMLKCLADPDDEERQSYLDWLDKPFDPSAFSLAEANAALQRLR